MRRRNLPWEADVILASLFASQRLKDKKLRNTLKETEKAYTKATKSAAEAEILLTQDAG